VLTFHAHVFYITLAISSSFVQPFPYRLKIKRKNPLSRLTYLSDMLTISNPANSHHCCKKNTFWSVKI